MLRDSFVFASSGRSFTILYSSSSKLEGIVKIKTQRYCRSYAWALSDYHILPNLIRQHYLFESRITSSLDFSHPDRADAATFLMPPPTICIHYSNPHTNDIAKCCMTVANMSRLLKSISSDWSSNHLSRINRKYLNPRFDSTKINARSSRG